MDFFTTEEAKEFKVVETAAVSVKVWEWRAKGEQASNVMASLPLLNDHVNI